MEDINDNVRQCILLMLTHNLPQTFKHADLRLLNSHADLVAILHVNKPHFCRFWGAYYIYM